MLNPQDEILKQILFGGDLMDKLAKTDSSTESSILTPTGNRVPERAAPTPDENRSALIDSLSSMTTPARNGKLSASGPHANSKSTFPKTNQLKNRSNRGQLLHYFANHELLAIETMAFVLLRFPEANAEFRGGVFRTLQDEQRHLGKYLKRMQEFGVELGDFPMNLYFWNTLRQMKSPLDFVTQMSLTFEQANLDFALFYAKLFQDEIDDEVTGKLLQEVHDDEIKHVAHGVKWFGEWREKASSEYEAYLSALPYPMTARRARGGSFFSAPSRIAAGMSTEFIEAIRISGGSRGKVPNYYYFNPQAELESSMEAMPKTIQQKIEELAPVMLWLGHEEDVVELPKRPPLPFLTQIYDFRGEVSEMVTHVPSATQYAAFEHFLPWGFGKSAWNKYANLKTLVRKPPRFRENLHSEKLFSKVFWHEALGLGHRLGPSKLQKSNPNSLSSSHVSFEPSESSGSPGSPGLVTSSLEESSEIKLPLLDPNWLKSSPFAEFIIKVDQSTSGRGHLRVPKDRIFAPEIQAKLASIQKREGAYVIEPYYPKVHDFSVQYELTDEGKLIEFEPRFFKVDHLFQYQGAWIGNPPFGSSYQKSLKLIAEKKHELKSAHQKVIDILQGENYVGPFGIDALTYQGSEGLEIVPVIEVNARYTMGRIAHEIEKIAQRKKNRTGVFRVLNARDLPDFKVPSFAALEEDLRAEFGEHFVPVTPSDNLLTWIFVVLHPTEAQRFLV